MSQPIRIALIGWNSGVRAARRLILDATTDMAVVFESDGGPIELRQLPDLLVDIIVIDQQLEQGSGIEAFYSLRGEYEDLTQVPKAVLTAPFDLESLRLLCFAAGMYDLVGIEHGPKELIRVIRAAAAQDELVDLMQLAELVSGSRVSPKGDFTFTQAIHTLPIRKKSILDKLARDWIGIRSGSRAKLSIEQLSPLVGPLGCLTTNELVIKLLQNGFLDGE